MAGDEPEAATPRPALSSSSWTGLEPEREESTSYTVLSRDPDTWRRMNPYQDQPPQSPAARGFIIGIGLPAWVALFYLLDWLVGDVGALTGGLISSIGGQVLKGAAAFAICVVLAIVFLLRLPDFD
ncbi:hypothetical protein IBL26_24095 [Roseomonas aerophila]|uniref:Uncharacterized protein n=1 Tax=Teichococcus aerophilus TaxID=1224513 RepID=A0ABR7RU99_9PROT|nr:hypothetical protein [Pseudoroseomonas aerophila]MBC9209938.1 hypothetical protein [Pseudoroseomonas aerophila]